MSSLLSTCRVAVNNTSLLELTDTSLRFITIHHSYVFRRLIGFIFSDCVMHYHNCHVLGNLSKYQFYLIWGLYLSPILKLNVVDC